MLPRLGELNTQLEYVDKNGFKDDDALNKILKIFKNNNKGFELLKKAKMPQQYNNPIKELIV